MKIPRFLFSFISTAYSLLLATLYLMQLSPRNRKAMHMQSRVLKNERRLFAWRGGRAAVGAAGLRGVAVAGDEQCLSCQ